MYCTLKNGVKDYNVSKGSEIALSHHHCHSRGVWLEGTAGLHNEASPDRVYRRTWALRWHGEQKLVNKMQVHDDATQMNNSPLLWLLGIADWAHGIQLQKDQCWEGSCSSWRWFKALSKKQSLKTSLLFLLCDACSIAMACWCKWRVIIFNVFITVSVMETMLIRNCCILCLHLNQNQAVLNGASQCPL